MKFGLFTIRNGYMSFKLFHGALTEAPNTEAQGEKLRALSLDQAYSVKSDTHSYIGSVHRKDLSVATPSLAGTKITAMVSIYERAKDIGELASTELRASFEPESTAREEIQERKRQWLPLSRVASRHQGRTYSHPHAGTKPEVRKESLHGRLHDW